MRRCQPDSGVTEHFSGHYREWGIRQPNMTVSRTRDVDVLHARWRLRNRRPPAATAPARPNLQLRLEAIDPPQNHSLDMNVDVLTEI